MSAIETLMNEHRAIESVLDALVEYAGRLDGGTAEPAELGRFVTFLREFADARHHGKEEDVLFATMAEYGFPTETGPIAVMLADHEHGRGLIGVMREAAERGGTWDAAERARIAEAAREYAALLRNHIWKEDNILYVMAQKHLEGDAMRRVDEVCARVDRERDAAGEGARLEELARALVTSFAKA
ncbi:MAG: hemerythrin domain-containing protein [Acidobacteria bacterium]|nr:hemerythrin domain-containing protein [Acidobacteriota bacterium]